MIDSYAAVVKKAVKKAVIKKKDEKGAKKWLVEPLIIQIDGKVHPQVEAISRSGIVPAIGDIVHVVTMRNNLDLEKIRTTDEATLLNSIIVGVLKANKNLYVYDYDREIKKNLTVKKDLTIEGDASFKGNLKIEGNLEVVKNIEVSGRLIIAGKDYTMHTHQAGGLVSPPGTTGGPVTGTTGTVI